LVLMPFPLMDRFWKNSSRGIYYQSYESRLVVNLRALQKDHLHRKCGPRRSTDNKHRY
jgi:hypothetical protein